MTLTPSSLRALLDRHGVRASRALGQNFLADPNTARRIVRLAEVDVDDLVFEIGPGAGSLTLALLDAGARVTALELDRTLPLVLADAILVSGLDPARVRVVSGDALTVDFGDLLGNERWTLVSNLPYNVATPIVMRVLEQAPNVDRMTVMVQREVGERWAAGPGTKDYGAVSVRLALRASAAVVGTVAPTVFVPAPRVDSALVRIERHRAPPVDVGSVVLFDRVVNAGFGQRRKMLRSSLTSALGATTEGILASAGVDPAARAETLGLAEWAGISRAAFGCTEAGA